MKMMKNNTRGILLFVLALTLCVAACVPAFASVGDRTLKRIDTSNGYWSSTIQNVFTTEEGVYILSQEDYDLNILFYPDITAEPEIYTFKDYNSYESQATEENSETGESVQAGAYTVGWMEWKGAIYALQYKQIFGEDSTDIEGGWLRRLVLKDGEASLEETDLPQLDWAPMIEDYGNYRSTRYPYLIFTSDDMLYCACYTDNSEEIVAFDLASGFAEEIELTEYPQIYPSTDGTILLTRTEWSATEAVTTLIMMDLKTRSEEVIGRFNSTNSSLQGAYYDKAGDRLIYSLDGQLMIAPGLDLANAEAVNDCPPDYDMQIQPLPGGFVLLWNQSTVAVRNTDPAMRSEITLNILDAGSAENLESTIYDFTNMRGDVSVVLRRAYGDDSVLQAITNRDASVDIYNLSYESTALEALRNRGYLLDIGSNAEIQEAFSRMYPWLQDVLRQDGKLTMVPTFINGWSIGYDPKAWKSIGLTEADVPHTWDQFFDLLAILPEKTQGTEYQPVSYGESISGFRSYIIQQLLEQYQISITCGIRDFAFNTPVLKNLLARLDAVDYEALNLIEDYQDEAYVEEGSYRESVLTFGASTTIQNWSDGREVMLLSLTADEDPILAVNMGVAFVNPYSEHQEEATAFLAASLRNLSVSSRYNCFTDATEPLRYATFQENLENTQKMLDESKASLEAADEENRESWETVVHDLEQSLEDMNNEWMISPKNISDYQKNSAFLRPLSFDILSSIMSVDAATNEYSSPVWEYTERNITADELLSMIDKKVQMMRLEGN